MKIVAAVLVAFAGSSVALAAPAARPPGAVACIDPQQMQGTSAEGSDTIIFHVGNRTYRNRLDSVCPGVERLNTFSSLETEPSGGQLCQGDTVRIFDQQAVRGVGINAYPRCRLGWFEPVPPKAGRP
ncbi:hypothetical protein [Sphingomonas oryzagri]|uniref:Uncharacterized protein n=1 Tax=Sphingomonas oryzagri TaxID=3042314 RepID=A0ABT6N3E2_9SPHN|nr:hypothetical protein [Sphingomonas oryzagri]MDH7639566.1 hypothetical protein [Sphingomonas oryzagri]